jgi:hypothetical protein
LEQWQWLTCWWVRAIEMINCMADSRIAKNHLFHHSTRQENTRTTQDIFLGIFLGPGQIKELPRYYQDIPRNIQDTFLG